jgi:hypothetical protein
VISSSRGTARTYTTCGAPDRPLRGALSWFDRGKCCRDCVENSGSAHTPRRPESQDIGRSRFHDVGSKPMSTPLTMITIVLAVHTIEVAVNILIERL